MTNQIPIGIYAGNPNGNDPNAESYLDQTVNAVTNLVGRAPTFMDTFADYSSWSNMLQSQQWDSWSFSQSPVAHNVTPVVGVPMATWSDSGTQAFQEIISGQHDDVYQGIANAWKAAGYTTIDARIGWEMEGNFMPWFMGTTDQSVSLWKQAFQHIADIFHNTAGINIQTVWNPGTSNNQVIPVANSYPGDNAVDIVGLDIYSPTWKWDPSVTDQQYWDNPSAQSWNLGGTKPVQWGMQDAQAFAVAHNKPFAIPETGAGAYGYNSDQPALPGYLASRLTAPGAPTTAFVNIWDVTGGDGGNWTFTDGSKPQEAQAWAQAFAPGSATDPTGAVTTGAAASAPAATPQAATPQTVGSGPDSLVLNLSEDAYQGDAQFNVTVDGTPVGGTYAVSASHSAGQTQAFTFNGNWGSGPHTIGVTFLNDAYGGSPSADRNLYVNSLSYDGTTQAPQAEQATNGTLNFQSTPGTPGVNASTTGFPGTPAFVGGSNQLEAPSASAVDATGNSSADTYAVNPGDGRLTLENFSAAKGDILQVNSQLAGALTETTASDGLLISFGNSDPAGVLLKGVWSLDPSQIHWT